MSFDDAELERWLKMEPKDEAADVPDGLARIAETLGEFRRLLLMQHFTPKESFKITRDFGIELMAHIPGADE